MIPYFLFDGLVDFPTHWTYMLIFRRIFLSNYWWQKSDIWSQASYRYPISWEAFFLLKKNWPNFLHTFLFIKYSKTTHWKHHIHVIIQNVKKRGIFSIDGRNLIFGHKLHIGTPYRGKRFFTRQIPTSCLPKSGGIISEH
jgi:hypothetical protein